MGCCNSNSNGNVDSEQPENENDASKKDHIHQVYTFGRTLGKGASCRVVEGVRKDNANEKVAIKIMSKEKPICLTLYTHEYQVLSSLNHQNIVKFICNEEDAENYYIVTGLLEGGELFDRIVNSENPITEKMASIWIRDMLSALQHCHEKNIVHRDLKPENFVFQSTQDDAKIVLIDFGCAKLVVDNQEYKELVGTVYYLAPELAAHSAKVPRTGKVLKAADIWSIGVIAYVMLTGRPPFKGLTNKEIFTNIIKEPLQFPDDVQLSDAFKDFVTKLLIKNPYKRMSLEDACRHPWVQGQDASDIKLNKDAVRFLRQFNYQSKLKKAVTRCLANNMSKEPEEEVRRHFKRLDKDGDGYLDEEELKYLLLDMGYAPAHVKSEAKKILEAVDINHDDHIDFEEFKQVWHRKLLTTHEQYIHRVFAVFDDNGDGEIDAAELQGALGGDFQTVIDMIKEVDDDHNNKISFEEFKKAMLEDITTRENVMEGIMPGGEKANENDRIVIDITDENILQVNNNNNNEAGF